MHVASSQKNGFNIRENRTEVFRFPNVSSFLRVATAEKYPFFQQQKEWKDSACGFVSLKK